MGDSTRLVNALPLCNEPLSPWHSPSTCPRLHACLVHLAQPQGCRDPYCILETVCRRYADGCSCTIYNHPVPEHVKVLQRQVAFFVKSQRRCHGQDQH
jgi:hypothetical protein